MKKLGKLSINPEKVIKNSELVNLRGGYVGEACHCSASKGSEAILLPAILFPNNCSSTGCTTECKTVYGAQYPGWIIIGICKPSD